MDMLTGSLLREYALIIIALLFLAVAFVTIFLRRQRLGRYTKICEVPIGLRNSAYHPVYQRSGGNHYVKIDPKFHIKVTLYKNNENNEMWKSKSPPEELNSQETVRFVE